ncbi:MAG: ion channel [Verrucomicrobiota bacterium]
MIHLIRTYRSVPLLLSVLLIMSTSVYREPGSWKEFAFISLWTSVTAFSALLLRPKRAWFIAYLSLAAFIILSRFALLCLGETRLLWETLVGISLCVLELIILGLLLRHAFRSASSPALDRIAAALAGYAVLAMIWSSLYTLVLLHEPAAIIDQTTGNPVELRHTVYYSIVTLTTQGYGDIVPVVTSSRMIAAFQGATGTIYLAVLVSVLLGMVQRKEQID